MALRKIKLYGKLGQIFGKEWNLDVNSVAEAIRAIDINTKGEFSKYLMSKNRYYRVAVKNKNNTLCKQEICGSFGSGDIYISPTIKGSGKYGQIIAGVVLIAVSYYMGGFGAGAAQAGTGSTAYWGSVIGSVGISMVIGGVAQLLMTSNAKDTDQRNSSLFQGNATTVYQGTSVGLAYGRVLVSPMPVCISSNARDVNTYDGDIMSIGTVGVVTTFLYSYKEGTASLCGFSELTDPTIPPKKYLTRTWSGTKCASGSSSSESLFPESCCYKSRLSSIRHELSGSDNYSRGSCSYTSNSIVNTYNNSNFGGDCGTGDSIQSTPSSIAIYAHDIITLTQTVHEAVGFGCFGYEDGHIPGYPGCVNSWYDTVNGTSKLELSDEDTESDAINRLLNSISWSSWQETPIYPYRNQRTTGFSFGYRTVRTKTNTETKFNPNLTYTYSITVQRRIAGSEDPWVDAETIEGMTKPDSSGDIIFPDVDNPAGYETRISTSTISI